LSTPWQTENERMGPPLISLKDWGAIEPFPGLSLRYLKETRCLPLKQEDGHVIVAMADPGDREAHQALEVALGARVSPVVASEEEILEFIDTVYRPGSAMSRLVGDLEPEDMDLVSEETSEIGHLRDMAREAPIIQLVNLLVLRAIRMGASDIHLEPLRTNFGCDIARMAFSMRPSLRPRDCRRRCYPA
jgi:general secretion pathway protein E